MSRSPAGNLFSMTACASLWPWPLQKIFFEVTVANNTAHSHEAMLMFLPCDGLSLVAFAAGLLYLNRRVFL